MSQTLTYGYESSRPYSLYYKHSNRVPVMGAIFGGLTGIAAGLVSGMIYAYAIVYSSFSGRALLLKTNLVLLVIPPVTNDFIALLKDSSLVSVITMVELTKMYGQLAATNYDYIGIGLLTAAIYFVLGLPIARLSRLLEARLAYMKV